MIRTVGLTSFSASSPIRPTVSGVLGRWTVMKSLCRQQLLQREQLHAELPGARRADVGVVGHDPHAERCQPLGDEHADPAQPDDADGLVEQLDAGVLAALPGPALERLVGRGDVAGRGQQQADGELGGGGDVGGRGVDDHDAGHGGGLDVDVVEADTGAGDDLQLRGRRERLLVDLGGRADEDGVDVGEGREQLVTVGAVAVADLEVRPEGVEGGGREFFGNQDNGLGH